MFLNATDIKIATHWSLGIKAYGVNHRERASGQPSSVPEMLALLH
jgi:hypothetical protein